LHFLLLSISYSWGFYFFFNSNNSINPFLITPSKYTWPHLNPWVCRFSFLWFYLSILSNKLIVYPIYIHTLLCLINSLCTAYESCMMYCTMYLYMCLMNSCFWKRWWKVTSLFNNSMRFLSIFLFFDNKFYEFPYSTNRVEASMKSKKVYSKILIWFIQNSVQISQRSYTTE